MKDDGLKEKLEVENSSNEPTIKAPDFWSWADMSFIDWAHELTSLVEDIFAIYYFDSDAFPNILVFLVSRRIPTHSEPC